MTKARPAVLLVDDIEANLVALEAQLARLDCELVRATSGNQALALLLRREFAVVLLDVQMPDMDGFEVARYARDNALTQDVPIVFVTAMKDTEDNVLAGYGAGAIDVIFKPVDPMILRSKVQVFLELYSGRRRLADAIEAHQETMRELDAFNYSVSHDLRAPVRHIESFSEALLEDHGDVIPPAGHELIGHIRHGAAKMKALIEDLLALSRSGRTPLKVAPLDLVPLIREIFSELQREQPERVVELVTPDRAQANGDPGLVRIVLENLLRNAWKFTSRRARARVELGSGQDKGERVWFLRDDGAGFDPQFMDQLFQPFRRLHTTAAFEGNGIGLAIVQRIVRRHGGRVWASSRPDHGATFYFTLPSAD